MDVDEPNKEPVKKVVGSAGNKASNGVWEHLKQDRQQKPSSNIV